MKELKEEVACFRAATYSENTKKTYQSQLNSYYKFCSETGVAPVPASESVLSMYAAYLARRLKPQSIKQYLNVVRLIHLECGYKNPCQDNWMLKSTLIGIERLLGQPKVRKMPITPTVLLLLKTVLQDSLFNQMWWAAALIMFVGTFRKSNLFPDSKEKFNGDKQFTRADFVATEDGCIRINVKWSKTNQFKKYKLTKKVFSISNTLCPVKALKQAFSAVSLPSNAPAFVIDQLGTPMTGSVFNKHLKDLIAGCGLNPVEYASHSFRRGSATWALQCGVPGEIVQHMGDWKSQAYLAYVDRMPQSVYDDYMRH